MKAHQPIRKRRYPLRSILAASALSTFLGLAACEAMARFLFPAPPRHDRQPQLGYLADPELTYINLPNQSGWVEEGLYTINSVGARGPELLSKEDGHARLLVIGDSITAGHGVQDDQTYCRQLEGLLREQFPERRPEVVNLGTGGYNTGQEVGLLCRRGPELDPDVVLVGFCWNDVLVRLPVTPDKQKRGILRPAQPSWTSRLLRRSRAIYCARRGLMQLIFLGRWPRDHRYKAAILEGTPLPELDKKWKQIEGDLARVRDAAEKNGWRVGVVILPPRDQVDRDYPQATYQIKVSEIAERLGFFTIDPLPTLVAERARVNQLFLPYDFDHPSPAGHRIIAEMIAEYFAEHPQLLDAAGESLGFLRGIPTRSVSEGPGKKNVGSRRSLADASG